MSAPYFTAPAVGRITSEYGPRGSGFHRGIDIAPPRPGQRGAPVVAAYGGTVRYVRRGVRHGDRSANAVTGTWNTGNAVLIDGPGGGSEWYGHLERIDVQPGQRVTSGQRLGTMGDSGNVTGVHLHLEMWNGRNQGGGANGPGNTRDPRVDFAKYGVTPGQPGTGDSSGSSSTAHPVTVPASVGNVLAWQRGQVYAPGLIADGVYGPASSAHYAWTRRLQGALLGWRSVQRMSNPPAVDGDYGSVTDSAVYLTQRDNHGGAYRGALDRIPGPVFCRMLGIPAHPGVS